MIFYFSGTGNSKYVASKIAKELDDYIIEMSVDSINKKNIYEIKDNERIGFVFPVYWYTLPIMVEQYISQLQIKNYTNNYVYSVVTYGGSSGKALNSLGKLLKRKGYNLEGKFGVKMVDNYVLAYNVADKDKQKERISQANEKLEVIIPNIINRVEKEITNKGAIAFLTPLLKPFYTRANHTKKFYATDSCNGCKQCERECPCNVIKFTEVGPTWDGNCSLCLKCISHCPKEAIQYGKRTEGRRRYYLDSSIIN